MEKPEEITTNLANNEDESDNLSPWPIAQSNDHQSEYHFEDNFCAKKNDELNQNGLLLPDSQQYLDILEKRLKKIQMENSGRGTQAKKMLKALATKRDEQFLFASRQNNIPGDQNLTPNENLSHLDGENSGNNINENNKLTSAIARSALLESLGKKMFPHLHSDDPEEYDWLLKHDVLSLLLQANQSSTITTNNDDNHDASEIPPKESKEC